MLKITAQNTTAAIFWLFLRAYFLLYTMSHTPDLRFPIGEYLKPAEVTDAIWQQSIADIAHLPQQLTAAVEGMTDEQLDTPYRPEGWTCRQVVHHLADSHINMFTRLKLALTEPQPTIKPYKEAEWAELPDYSLPIAISLELLNALHTRWAYLLRSLDAEQRQRGFIHPEYGKVFTIDQISGFYAWHGKHHTAHITALRQRRGW